MVSASWRGMEDAMVVGGLINLVIERLGLLGIGIGSQFGEKWW